MKGSDEHTAAPFMSSLTIYKCPVCRYETLIPWHKRPRNIALQSISEKHAEYGMRLEEIGLCKIPEDFMSHESDLSRIAFIQQELLGEKLYQEILPALRKAVVEGRSLCSPPNWIE